MNVGERVFKGCRIYAAALPVPSLQGFHAAVVVMTERDWTGKRHEVFRDERLYEGRVWMDPDGAVAFAVEAGQAAMEAQIDLDTHLQNLSAATSMTPVARRQGSPNQ